MSPEDAFQETINQKWISAHDAQLTAMLTQYIFGLMDRDTYEVLSNRVSNPILKLLFQVTFKIALLIVKLRWRFKFFDLRLDYKLFSLVHKYSGLI